MLWYTWGIPRGLTGTTVPKGLAVTTIFPNRTFGVELELVGLDRNAAVRALAAVNVACVNSHYTHRIMETWKIVDDSSVESEDQHSDAWEIFPRFFEG